MLISRTHDTRVAILHTQRAVLSPNKCTVQYFTAQSKRRFIIRFLRLPIAKRQLNNIYILKL